jgi:ribosome-binding factor A
MSLSKRERERLLKQVCGTINEDDAIDPRHYFYNKRKHDKKFRKAFQLCRQVADTLHLVINEAHPALEGVTVVDVVPAPDSRRMLVIVSLDPAEKVESAADVEKVMACLQASTPRLRAEIARSINRKKTPNLVFEIARMDPK